MSLTETETEMKQYYKQVNEYFNNLRQCDIKHKHESDDCCYIGTVEERLQKYNELKTEHENDVKRFCETRSQKA